MNSPHEDANRGEYDPREVNRNFRLLAADSILFGYGISFFDPSTILPAFLASLTHSTALIGAIVGIRSAAALIPQLWSAHYLRNRRYHKSFLIGMSSIARVVVTLFAILLFMARPADHGLILWGFVAMYSLFWLSAGGTGVSWTDLIGKTIPERMRGRLFGFNQFTGGIMSLTVGLITAKVLAAHGLHYPRNFAVLWMITSLACGISLLSLSRVHEPEGTAENDDANFVEYVEKTGKALLSHRIMRRLLAVQILTGSMAMSAPFFILQAKASGVTGGLVGIMLTAQMVGGLASSVVNGYLSDKLGPRLVLIKALILGIAVCALAVVAHTMWTFVAVFFIGGWTGSSSYIGLTNYFLEMAEPDERRGFFGIMSTVNGVAFVFPILGGVIAQAFSYHATFITTGIAFATALTLALGLKNKRNGVEYA